jgi:hypothetical protein
MRHTGALSKLTSLTLVAAAILLAAGRQPARAQIIMDGIDFNLDRGSYTFYTQTPTGNYGAARRLGYNAFTVTVNDPNNTTQPYEDSSTNNNPGYAVRRWVWPSTADLTNNGQYQYTVDNPFPGVANFPAANPSLKVTLSGGQQPNDALTNWGSGDWPNAEGTINSGQWIIPFQANRVPEGGFGYVDDPTQEIDFDYGCAFATQETFTYLQNNTQTTATLNDLIPLPYVPAPLYNSVFNTLTNTGLHPVARYSMGSYNTVITGYTINNGTTTPVYAYQPIPTGDYHVQIWSPGSGTQIADGSGNLIAHPNVYHAFVQVSYYKTVNGNNSFNLGVHTTNVNHPWTSGAGGINDPEYSRLFLIDMSQQGWHDIQANATALNSTPVSPALFHYTEPANYNPNNAPITVANQIVVTIYAVTPDNINDTTLFGASPLVTADAVRFVQNNTNNVDITQLANANNPAAEAASQAAINLGPIQANGRILGPVVSTNKFRDSTATNNDPFFGFNNDPINGLQENQGLLVNGVQAFPNGNNVIANRPLFFVAREETFAYSQINPGAAAAIPIDPTVTNLMLATDPDHTITRPVFYCLGSEEEAILNPLYASNNTLAPTISEPSLRRIRWRYVGMPDTGGGTATASPLIADVRCRDNVVRPMVFFVTTSQDGTLGHIYAFDPIGYNPVGDGEVALPYATGQGANVTGEVDAGDFGTTLPSYSLIVPPTTTNFYSNFVPTTIAGGTLHNLVDGIDTNGNPTVPGVTNTYNTDGVLIEPAQTASALLLPSRSTRCYWIYPSLRPTFNGLLQTTGPNAGQLYDPNEPSGVPNQWHDPNYSLPQAQQTARVKDMVGGTGSFYPGYTFENTTGNTYPDQAIPYYDGDIIGSAGGLIVRPDTQIHLGGITAAPMIMDDPDNPTGPQILVIVGGGSAGVSGQATNQGTFAGHAWAFDAGGRGDYDDTKLMPTFDNNVPGAFMAVAEPTVALDPTQPPVTIPGTTQRLWTWPHLGVDAFHATVASDANGYDAVYAIQDDPTRGNFINSPAFDPAYPTINTYPTYIPVLIPSDDGHLYAVLPFHDVLLSVTANVANYNDLLRTYWSFPNANLSTTGGIPDATLGNSPSTPAAFATSNGTRYLYFTCDLPGQTGAAGRVYSIAENIVVGPRKSSTIPYALLNWVFPYSDEWPYADPNVANSVPLFPGFTTSAPVAINANFTPPGTVAVPNPPSMFSQLASGNTLPYDMVYVTMNDGTVVGLAADPLHQVNPQPTAYTTALYGVGGTQANTLITGHTLTTPMVSWVEPNPNLGFLTGLNDTNYDQTNDYQTSYPALIYSDDNGNIYGVGLLNSNDGSPTPGSDGYILPTIYYYGETQAIRDASVILSNAWLAQGDHGGQVRAYSVGNENNVAGDTVPGSEGNGYQNLDPGLISIDIRTVDYYTQANWNNFMLSSTSTTPPAPGTSPGFTSQGSTTHQVSPIPVGQFGLDNVGGIGADWGEYVYVAAWGVYHSMPSRGVNERGMTAPRIDVTFNITQTGASASYPITVPAVQIRNGAGTPPPWAGLVPGDDGWPDVLGGTNAQVLPGDEGYTGAASGLTIFGLDPNTWSGTGTETLRSLQGPTNHVYPWVAVYRIRIVPTQTASFQPGAAGITVTAQARITQTVAAIGNSGNVGNSQQLQKETFPMAAGQHDYNGDQSATPQNPNDRAVRGRGRPVYIGRPLALTVRNYTSNPNAKPDMTGLPNDIGWGGGLLNGTYNDIRDLFGNGPQIGIGDTALSPATGVTISANAAVAYKSLFAPFDMAQDGTTQTYSVATDNTGLNRAPGVFVMDRTNLMQLINQPLRIQSTLSGYQWAGDTSSVMNPLPWEQLPDNTRTTADYPALPTGSAHLVGNNLDLTHGATLPLVPPTQPTSDPADRIPQPTPLALSLDIPIHTPANVNRGMVSYTDQKTHKTYHFGSTYTDPESGAIRGTSGATDLMAPLTVSSGLALGGPSSVASPAGGYISQFQIQALRPPGANGRPTPGRGNNSQPVFDSFENGISVAPNVKLVVQQETLDFGKLPGATGYSSLNGSDFSAPFSPTGLTDYLNSYSPWNDPTQYGNFFLPFSVKSQSNINLVDLRIAKLYGEPGAVIDARSVGGDPSGNVFSSGAAISTGLTSQEVNNLLLPPLPSIAFGRNGSNASGPGLGNIGITSSIDHGLFNPAIGMAGTSERSVYAGNGIPNPAVSGNVASEASQLYNGGTNNFLLDLWQSGYQPRPTLHKPLPGSAQGSVATVPDVPAAGLTGSVVSIYNGGSTTTFTPSAPQIGIAIPFGTPVGLYTGRIYPYEDNIPIQWREWLSSSLGSTNVYDLNSQDGIFNENSAGAPLEPVADPGLTLRVTVKENQLTGGTGKGSYSQIDQVTLPLGSQSTVGAYNQNVDQMAAPIPLGFNVQPGVLPIPTGNQSEQIYLFWTTNRQVAGSQYTQNVTTKDNGTQAVPIAEAPVNLAYSALQTPYALFSVPGGGTVARGDVNFANVNGNQSTYWLPPQILSSGTGPFTGLAGTAVPNTVRYGSPSAALANDVLPNGNYQQGDTEAYLLWYGQVDKQQNRNGVLQQVTESRTFYTALNNGVPSANVQSFLNDSAVTKLGPKPLLAKFQAETRGGASLPALKFLYVFWYAGNNTKTSLYYNANVTATTGTFSTTGWDVGTNTLGDQQLPIPNVLSWESDPHPVLRRVTAIDPFNPGTASAPNYRTYDAVDLYYTGVLRNRQKVEILMSRYGINRGEYSNMKPGQLFLLDLPAVTNEVMSHSGTTSTYTTRDVGWDTASRIVVAIQSQGATVATTLIDTSVTQPLVDAASGLTYANLPAGTTVSGGRMAIDVQSGTVSFPNIAPQTTDTLYVTYTPLVMRLNTSRNTNNAIDGIFQSAVDSSYPNDTAPGDNSQAMVIMDRATNPRAVLANPVVVPANTPIDRLWVLYHKTDLSGGVKSNIYYKTMRLLARLPFPVALTTTNGQQSYSLTVQGAAGAYEVDWARGRVYFTEADEGNTVTVSYIALNGNTTQSVSRTYRVAWGDEISVTGTPDQTTQEVPLPTDRAVNEGQVTAFKDPLIDKLWVFWSSTRAGVSDIYCETIAPQFYPTATNQQ